jgi:hypothetical protein
MFALVGGAAAERSADDPSTILALKTRDFANCVKTKKAETVILTLFLDAEARVKKVDIDASGRVKKAHRQCLEREAKKLQFGGTMAHQTLEHQFQVVNTGLARPTRR